MPAEPAATCDRQSVLDALVPGTADDIARVQHEQSKVSTFIAAIRLLPEIIATASRGQLAAILDSAETSPEVLEARDPTSVLDALREMIWERLVRVEEAAQAMVAAEEATIPARAWRSIPAGVGMAGSNPFEGRVLPSHADPAAVLGLLDDGDAEAMPVASGNLIESMMDGLDRVPVDPWPPITAKGWAGLPGWSAPLAAQLRRGRRRNSLGSPMRASGPVSPPAVVLEPGVVRE